MSIARRKDRFCVFVYEPLRKDKMYVGSFATREEAEEAETSAKALELRKCRVCRRSFRPIWPEQLRCSSRCMERPAITRRTRQARPLAERKHWVYICSDEHGEVLYIGVTGAGIRRHHERGREASWWDAVALIKVEHFPTREAAVERERDLLAAVNPECNSIVMGSRRGSLGR